MERHILLFLCLHFCYFVFGQGDRTTPMPIAYGLGGTSSLIAGPEAAFGNISGLSAVRKKHGFIATGIPFGIPEIAPAAAALIVPFKKGTSSFTASRTGNKYFSHQNLGCSYSHQIDRVRLGGAVKLSNLRIEESASRNVLLIIFGGQVLLLDDFSFGASIHNFNLAKVSKSTNERLPVVMQVGVQWKPISVVNLNLEVEKDMDQVHTSKAGLEYLISNYLTLRTGFSTNPNKVHLGGGLAFNKFAIHYASVTHPYLGLSHYLSIHYTLPGE